MRIRMTLIPIGLLTAVMGLFVAGSVAAGPLSQDPGTSTFTLAGTVASKISYQGRLTDAAGNPLNGSYNLVFQLWNDATAGSQVGSDIVQNSVPVSNGLFTVELDVPQSAFNGQALWLRIQVNGQWLSPRQELLPVPYALGLRPGAQIEGSSTDAIASVVNQGLGVALYAQGAAMGVEGVGMTGVRGGGDVGVRGEGITGVSGISGTDQGVGVSGQASGINGKGVEGSAAHGTGVVGYGELGGVKGTSTSTGVLGEGVTSVSGGGALVGVSGYTEGDQSTGVLGTATGYGGKGVEGNAQFGIGVLGTGETGMKGTSSVGPGVKGEGSIGVEGFSQTGDGVLGESQGGAGSAAIRGVAIGNAYGGYFTSTNGTGVVAIGYEGLHAETTSNIGYGVHGMSAHIGVQGDGGSTSVGGSGSINGVYGYSNMGNGVEGRTVSGAGVLGVSTYTDGVVGNSQNGVGVYGNSGGEAAIKGEGPKGVYGRSSADGGEGVHGHGMGSATEGVLGTSDQATGVYGISGGTSALAIGVWGQTNNATWGLATWQKLFVGGGCTGCTVAFVGQNGDTSPLEVGDVVSISGIAPPLKGQQTPTLKVQRATATGSGALGVVQARAVVTTREVPISTGDAAKTDTFEIPGLAPGQVAPDDYLFVVVQGLVQVQADASSGAIEVGDPVGPIATAGHVQKLDPVTPAAPVLGRALEPVANGTGLIWVLVLGR
jgi:hypothetical protein